MTESIGFSRLTTSHSGMVPCNAGERRPSAGFTQVVDVMSEEDHQQQTCDATKPRRENVRSTLGS